LRLLIGVGACGAFVAVFLRRPATGTRTTKPHALLMVARRYAETEAVRAFGAFVAVVVLVVLSGLAWFWLFGAPSHVYQQ
jgi:hypothetical protein